MENDRSAGTQLLMGARKTPQSLTVVMAAQHRERTKSLNRTVKFTSIYKKKREAALAILILEALQDALFSEKSNAWDCE